MSKYYVTFKIEGSIDVEADSFEEAREKFYKLSDVELLDNCYIGANIDDIYYEGEDDESN